MSTEQTPAKKLAELKKTIADAKREADRVRLELPRAEWSKEYEARKARTLTGTKYVDVEVRYEIDKDDLTDLGFHHEDDCSGITYDPEDDGDNLRALSDWHDKAHGLSLWASCPYEPCKLLTADFRKTP
jgi:hypothetical protein